MEPNHNNYLPPAELPAPQEGAIGSLPEQPSAVAPEIRATQPPVPSAGSQQSLQVPVSVPLSPGTPVADNTQQQSAQTTQAMIADDADLIEKEWVTRAKAIVMQTRDDPHKQNTEMNKVKADYLKKRYNKDLKLNEQ